MTMDEAQKEGRAMLWQCICEDWRKIAALALVAVIVCTGAVAAKAETPDADIKRVEIERMTFGEGVTVIHDDRRAVTCWVFSGLREGGMSCIPDWMLIPQKIAKPAEVRP